MKSFKNILIFSFAVFVMTSFFQCASMKQMESKSPLEIGEVYFQSWTAGIKEGGSGTNIFIPVLSNPNSIILDSVYYLGQKAKLQLNDNIYTGIFNSSDNQKHDFILSSDPTEEFGNKVLSLNKEHNFNLKENECVISYQVGNKVKYFKIEKVLKKQLLAYPSTSPKKQ